MLVVLPDMCVPPTGTTTAVASRSSDNAGGSAYGGRHRQDLAGSQAVQQRAMMSSRLVLGQQDPWYWLVRSSSSGAPDRLPRAWMRERVAAATVPVTVNDKLGGKRQHVLLLP